MWVSVLLTPTTTVKSVVELVHSMVERRMGARLCEEGDVHNFSSTTTPAGSFAMVPSHAGTTDETGHRAGSNSGRGARGGGTTTLTPSPTVSAPTVQVVSPTSKTAPSPAAAAAAVDSTEWCLCVQDGDGVFHWMGSTRHYQKSAVLHAPFAAEACLQSHAAFEAERLKLKAEARARRKAQVRTSAGGSSRRASFATQGGPAALEGSDSASTAASTLGSDSSSRSSSAGEAEGDGAAGRGGRRGRRLPRPFHHRHTHITDGSGKAGRRDTKTNRKRRGGKAAELPDAPDTLRSSSATAKAFANPSADEAKFAFLKGVVVPSLVLQQRNPALARHRHRLPLYSEVHVPRAMRAEPLDPAPATPTMIKPSPTSETAEVPSAPAPALGSPSSVAAKASFDMPLVHTSFSKEEDVDVDVPPSVPAQTGSSASLASTPPTPAPQQAHAAADSLNATLPPTGVVDNGTDAAAAADAPRKSWTTWGESREDAEGREPTRAADGHTDAPVGLVPHATARGRRVSGPLGAVADEKATEGRPGDAADVEPKTAAEVPVQWTKEEDVARLGLAAAQRDYAAALAAYRAAVPPPPTSIHEHLDTAKGGADAASVNVDAELAALMKRKVELQAAVEAGRQAERQCERLTALVECMEKELREREERRALLTAR
ncbi:hypothetical protein ABB37_07996 [Leptomonas pyrrhocoris]|uniref:Uncharacterized protein n=1 Tax=Leptomonas pyrrhocoris TaxID=157538 RepID=A0A0N0DSX8_LEPPY|nr:hypothetical protein ABB37_07996 [Leptomonas pyrrhocoris]KPA76254.1 hypothetical protein ABB37_07996 [Leptomonas pyrrhocoris]|eukprot:XP_015654693.1 hypothetical protein ABB37_07996 [Leptomonas pyrrhocoris]